MADPFFCVDTDATGQCTTIELAAITDQDVTAIVTDSAGCREEIAARLSVFRDRRVFIPNVFSPNNDGVNDIFKPSVIADGGRVASIRIFGRWGDLIFEQAEDGPAEITGWDGMTTNGFANPGVYTYIVEVVYEDDVVRSIGGDITVIR